MSTQVEIPALGESVTQATLLKWHKQDGEAVAKDEPIAELETDKANVDLPAPAAGTLHLARQEGDTVAVGEVIARIDDAPAGAAVARAPKPPAQPATQSAASDSSVPSGPASEPAPAPAPAAAQGDGPAAEDLSPAGRRLVEEHQVDTRNVAGTGPHGRITKEDVVHHLAEQEQRQDSAEEDESVAIGAPGLDTAPAPGEAPAAVPANAKASAPAPARSPLPAPAKAPQLEFDPTGIRRVPMSRIRKRIAQNLVQAQHTAAILTTYNEVDMSAVLSLRGKYKERFQEVHGIGLGLMSFFARASVLALKEFPRINAFIDGDDIVYHQYVHLGIAVSTDRGLAVPVLRHVENMSFARIETEIKRLATATRDGKLSVDELAGGTFTITNGGVFGSMMSTPILNAPQSGILGMHAILKRPVAVDDKVEIRPMMYLALSYDHRAVDGRESVSFLVRLKQYLEDPARLMLEI